MTMNSILGAVGRRLMRCSPPGMRRTIWDRVWWRAFPYTTTTRDGFRMHGDTTDLIQRYIYYFGEWEPVISKWFRQHVQQGDTVVDVGANVGWYTLLAARLVGPLGRVVAIEASPSIALALTALISISTQPSARALPHSSVQQVHRQVRFRSMRRTAAIPDRPRRSRETLSRPTCEWSLFPHFFRLRPASISRREGLACCLGNRTAVSSA